jgi:protein-S-isoprenylcysteine O-methyltransferase Ste14
MTSTAAAGQSERASSWLVRYGNFLFKYRNGVFPIVMVALFALSRPYWPAGRDDYDTLLDITGFAVALAGQLIRSGTVGYAYILRGGKDKQVYAEELVTRGMFNHSRNPLYLGNLLIVFGLLLVWNSPLAYLVGGTFFLVGYVAIVEAEEVFLSRKFGEQYEAYAKRVPRWRIRLGDFKSSMEGMSFNWRRVVLKEYNSAAFWIGAALALMLADSLRYQPWSSHSLRHAALAAGIALTVIAWGVVRWLKKSKRLQLRPRGWVAE